MDDKFTPRLIAELRGHFDDLTIDLVKRGQCPDFTLLELLDAVQNRNKEIESLSRTVDKFNKLTNTPTIKGSPISNLRLEHIREFLSRFSEMTAGGELLSEIDRLRVLQ